MANDIWKIILAANAAGAAQDEQLKAAAEKIGHQPEEGPTSGNRKQTENCLDEQVGKTEMDAKAILHTRAMEQAGVQLEGNTWDDPREAANARNLGVTAGGTPKAPIDTNRHNTQPANVHLPRPVSVTSGAGGRPKMGAQKTAGKVPNFLSRAGSMGREAAGKVPNFLSRAGSMGREAAGKAGKVVKKHPFASAGVAAGGGAAVGAMAARRKEGGYRLADHYEAVMAGPEAVKTAAEKFPEAEILGAQKRASYGYLMGVDIAIGQLKEAAGIPTTAAA